MSIIDGKIVSGKKLAERVFYSIALETKQLEQQAQRVPCLAVILIGENPASQVYVRNKKNACAKVGIKSLEYLLDKTATQAEVLAIIQQLNQDQSVDGILVQLPLPEHLDSLIIIDSILSTKDVDGFSRYNMGSLAIKHPQLSPCTPHGVMLILDELHLNYFGKHAVILGMSNIVGRPMALELMNRGATVTVCNSKTTELDKMVSQADILISAIGRPNFITGEWLKSGVIVIDVGINRLDNGKLCGDIDFISALDKVKYITPVPGGVGPMTIAMLLQNTMKCYQLHDHK